MYTVTTVDLSTVSSKSVESDTQKLHKAKGLRFNGQDDFAARLREYIIKHCELSGVRKDHLMTIVYLCDIMVWFDSLSISNHNYHRCVIIY